jgi:hypothetical protein
MAPTCEQSVDLSTRAISAVRETDRLLDEEAPEDLPRRNVKLAIPVVILADVH